MARKKKEIELPQITQEELIQQKAIGEIARDAFLDFGNYINNQRHTAFIQDGCKPSYRRLIYSALQFPKGKMIPSTTVISSVANYHPHSLSGIEELNANLVHTGVFEGHGSWGYMEINGTYNQYAAPRYTKQMVSDVYNRVLGELWKEVPMVESPVGPMEISYLPLPIPLCLRGDTKIYLTDGRNLTIKEVVKEFEQGKENYVLSCNLDGDFSIAKIINGCKTKTSKKYIRFTLDNGEVINSTEDHRFLMRDGEYKKAEELEVGDSMMPGYFTTGDFGRLAIKNNFSLNSPCIYKLASLYNIQHGIYQYDPEKNISHHIDKNINNNNPNNIINLSNKEHSKVHLEDRINAITPEVRDKIKESLKTYWKNESNREKAKKKWKDDGDTIREDGKTRREISREQRVNYNKSQKAKDNISNFWNDEERSAEARKKLKATLEKRNKDPEFIEHLKDSWNSEKGLERKKKSSIALSERNKDPEHIRKSNRGHIVSRFKKLINKEGYTYEEALEEITSRKNFNKWFDSIDDFKEYEKTWNHTIVNIEVIEDTEEQDFYDITVDSRNHNFLLSCGIIAHNCLYMKTSVTGLCIGVKNDYPNFSPKSLYQAYINNNPLLLEPNANLIIDKENSELDRLWKTGKGRVIYSYKLTRVTDDFGNPGILFEGDTFLFTPNFKKFKKLAEEGKVYMEDLTDINGPKMVISKVPGARGISIEEIEDLARKCCYSATNYTTNVTTGSTMFRIGLYDWLDYTYKNYIDLIVKVNQKKIEKTTFDIAVLEAIPLISDYILNKNPKATDEEIMKVFGMPQEIVSSVMSKPISYLRKNKDTSDRIKELKTRLKELKKFDPVAYTEQIINQL